MLLHKMKLFASDDDRATYELFQEAGIIVEHSTKHVAGQQTCSWCADGFRPHMKETVEGHCRTNGGDETFFHSFAGNGDAMRFAFNSPLSSGFSEDGDLDVWGRLKLEEIRETLGWAEGLNMSVAQHRLVHHWPCKAAVSRGITLSESVFLVICGKMRIKHQIPQLKVAIDLWCDWAPREWTLNLVKKEAYLRLIATDARFAHVYDKWCTHKEEVRKLPTYT